jgi:hypothetical protein
MYESTIVFSEWLSNGASPPLKIWPRDPVTLRVDRTG